MRFTSRVDADRPLAIASVEGADNFQEKYVPALGVVVFRTLGAGRVYLLRSGSHNTAAGTDQDRDTGYGHRRALRLRPTVFVVGEVTPRASAAT